MWAQVFFRFITRLIDGRTDRWTDGRTDRKAFAIPCVAVRAVAR